MNKRQLLGNKWVQLLLFTAASFILYVPIINKSFAADDFLVLRRVGLDKKIFIQGFFRPLADLTLYGNFLIGGFCPCGYYLLNILIHGLNCFLLFRFCLIWKWTIDSKLQMVYAVLASILFLTYPFHSEAIVWVLGRGASIACAAGLSALLFLVSDLPERVKILGLSLCYFIGLAAYESITLLPLLVLVVLNSRHASWLKYTSYMAALGLSLGVNLMVRVFVSGSILGSYAEGFFRHGIAKYFSNLPKIVGRLFIPPNQDTASMVLLFCIVIGLLTVGVIYFFRKSKEGGGSGYFIKLGLMLTISAVIPLVFDVSTKTSESDRFLYFPSIFVCCCIALLVVRLFYSSGNFYLVVCLMLAFNVFYLEKGNVNWLKASRITRDIIGIIKQQDPAKTIYLIDLPDEWNGAFIFRSGLDAAVLINSGDTSKLRVVNHLKREQMLLWPDTIQASESQGRILIPPGVTIMHIQKDSFKLSSADGNSYLIDSKNAVIFFWNKRRLIRIE